MATDTAIRDRQGRIDAHALGLVLGVCLGAWHLAWALLVLAGWAQALVDFVFWLHFIAPPYRVGPFVPWRGAVLIAITSIVGYLFGRLAASVWNVLERRPAPTRGGPP